MLDLGVGLDIMDTTGFVFFKELYVPAFFRPRHVNKAGAQHVAATQNLPYASHENVL